MKLENLKKPQRMNHITKALQISCWKHRELFNLQSLTCRLRKDLVLFRMKMNRENPKKSQ